MSAWVNCQYLSLINNQKYPNHYHIVRYEDIISNKVVTLSNILHKIGIGTSDTLSYPSWNGEKLNEVYPWGTVRIPTEEVNLSTALELNKNEVIEIYIRSKMYIDYFNYNDIYNKIK